MCSQQTVECQEEAGRAAEPGLLQVSMDWEMSENVLEFKLVDVPELGYLTTDKPFPRGELLLKTHSQIKGYYKHAEVRCWGCSRARKNPKPCTGQTPEARVGQCSYN